MRHIIPEPSLRRTLRMRLKRACSETDFKSIENALKRLCEDKYDDGFDEEEFRKAYFEELRRFRKKDK